MNGITSGDQAFLDKLTGIIHANLENENFGVNELARHAGISSTRLHRRLMDILSKPPCQFIREIRLYKAKELLQAEGVTAAEAAYSVGFGSPSYFNTCFHDFFGYPPGKVARKEVAVSGEEKPGKENRKEKNVTRFRNSFRMRKVYRITMVLFIIAVILLQAAYLILTSRTFAYNFATITLGTRLRGMEKSVAVLPFKNLTDSKETGYFVEGVTEDINNQLQKINEFRVVSRTSVEQFRSTNLPATKIAGILKVNFLMSGSVQKYGSQLVINAELIDAKYDQVIWSQQFRFELSDIYRIQVEIATQIASKLQSQLTEDEHKQITKIPSVNSEAITNYLKGRFHWNLRTEKDLTLSLSYFHAAIKADPNFAPGYAGLADSYYFLVKINAIPDKEGIDMAKQMVAKALSLDNNLSEAHATRGALLFNFDWKWEESRIALQKAIQLKPDYAIAHQYYSELLSITGQPVEARKQMDMAITLDPNVPRMYLTRASYYIQDKKYEEALATCLKSLEISPQFYSAYYQLTTIYHLKGDDNMALESLQRAFSFSSFTRLYMDSIQPAYRKDGWKGVAMLQIRMEYAEEEPSNVQLSKFYLELGKKEKALALLEQALEKKERSLSQLATGTIFEELYGNPRFDRIVEKVGLPRTNTIQ